jgi:hypothetical protein
MQWRLAISAGVVMGIGFTVFQMETMWHGAMNDGPGLHYFQDQSTVLKTMLQAYSKSHGRYPSNDEGLSPVADIIKRTSNEHSPVILRRCRITPSGVLSWWGEPLIYENRRGKSPSEFVWSKLDHDLKREYSRKVDDGIYIWSVGAMEASPRWRAKNIRVTISLFATLILSLGLLCAFVRKAVRMRGDVPKFKKALLIMHYSFYGSLLMLACAWPFIIFGSGCGCSGGQKTRTPELTKSYVSTMKNYRKHGIISNATLEKILYNLKADEKDRMYRRRY